MSTTFKDQVCLVTGASGDIGRAIANRLASAGARVVGWGMSRTPEDPSLALAQCVDVRDAQAVSTAVNGIVEKLGRIDILITCAGISLDRLSLRLPDPDWNRVLETNLTGTWHCAKEVAKHMILQKSGVMLFISSLAAHHPHAGQAAYAASKGAVESLTRALAVELAPKGIRVNALAPGFVEGSMTEAMEPDTREKVRKRIPLARFAAPSEVAAAATFLVSPDAGYMTAQILDVHGGLGM